jgi:predicted permease
MAVRLSLGAGRARLVRQLLTESMVFSLLAGAAGVGLAWVVIGLLNHIPFPAEVRIDPDLRLSIPVLLFSLGVSLFTGVLFGLAPALQSTRPHLVSALKGESSSGGSRSRMSRTLVVAQMALSLVLLVCAGLFLRNLRAATSIDKGFTSDNLLVASVDPALQGYERARTVEFYRRLVERVRELPGVTSVGLGEVIPLSLGSQQRSVEVPGYTPAPNERMSIDYNIVTPGYFEAMGIPLARGRGFTAQDDSTAPRVAVVNQRFADRFWPGQNAVGKQFRQGNQPVTVIGVVRTGKYSTLGEKPLAYAYYPQAQLWNSAMNIHVRTATDPASIAPRLRAEVAALDENLPISSVRTMNDLMGVALLPARLAGSVLGVFGLLGLVLAAVGMYGVMSYSVAQRTREIGIRMAVGAASGQVVSLVVRQGVTLVLLGAGIGLAGALGASQLVRGMLYGGSALDPLTFIGVPLVLLGVAMLAIWIPARRAATVDPMVALRME